MTPSKIVVLTGASSGIGAVLAKLLASQGCGLALAARREAELKAVAQSCGGQAVALPTDVARRRDMEALRDRTLERFGRIDVWINNAGQGITRPVLELSEEEVDAVFAVNFKSALYGMQVAVPVFIKQGRGHLINVSSFLGRVPLVSFRSAYSAAKAALNSLTSTLRMDLKKEHPGIHVSTVLPGIVMTEFGKKAIGGAPSLPPAAGLPVGRQSAEEVAAQMAALIENPVAELYTQPQLKDTALAYFGDVGAFEEKLLAGRG